MGCRVLREAIKRKGFLVDKNTMERWLEHYHMIAKRVELAQPLPCFDRKALQLYEARLLQYWHTGPKMTYAQLKQFLEQTFGRLSFDIMWQMRTPFQHLGCYQIEWCGSDYGRP